MLGSAEECYSASVTCQDVLSSRVCQCVPWSVMEKQGTTSSKCMEMNE